ncbi:restriction endonuclease subunit S [Vibrio navarrensis]|uniref:restriction endonuclease subunit S n=1 Tax=Vibrio navarrensis TaxID=29495 RepID=UPI00186A0E1F|nr:restriction endonuclease subunit S [Vibrio navarrensis]MBE4609263.1 hypothetical protein [Vibrio navarrensis]MBE4612841.1 hypothetical protein [Vibrio navarrensis]
MGSKWESKLLGELCHEITVGFVGSMTNEYIDDGVPFLRSKNIEEYNVKWEDMKYVSQEFHQRLKKSALRAGDVAIVRTGKPGTTCVIPEELSEANCSDIVIARVNDEVLCPHYLSYFMNAMAHGQINAHVVGAVQQHFNVGSAKKLMIPLPAREIQSEIVGILKALDDKIKINLQINQTLEQMAQTLFKSWFVDFDPVMDNALDAGNPIPDELQHRAEARKAVRQGRATADKEREGFKPLPDDVRQLFPDAFEESELGWVPKGWAVRKISDFGSVICGKTPSKKIPEYYGSDVPFLKIPDMHGNVFVVKTTDRLSSEGSNSQVKKLVPKDSISVSCIATVGLVSISTDPMHTNQQINSIVPSQPRFRDYLYFSMKEKRKQFHDLASGGSTTLNMNTGVFSRVSVLKPSDAILDMFQTRSSALLERIKLSSTENESLAALRDTLLPKLISGELCLDNAEAAVVQETVSA